MGMFDEWRIKKAAEALGLVDMGEAFDGPDDKEAHRPIQHSVCGKLLRDGVRAEDTRRKVQWCVYCKAIVSEYPPRTTALAVLKPEVKPVVVKWDTDPAEPTVTLEVKEEYEALMKSMRRTKTSK